MDYNKNSLDTLCGALSYAMGITPPTESAEKNEELAKYIDEKFGGKKADRIFLGNCKGFCSFRLSKKNASQSANKK